jgi:hypothetical protein
MKVAERYYSCPNCKSKISGGIGVMFCNRCETLYCASCSPGGSQCPCCHAINYRWAWDVHKEQEQKRINNQYSNSVSTSSHQSGGESSSSGGATVCLDTTEGNGKGFFIISCIAAIWLLPAMITLWAFILIWYWLYKIFKLDWKPFDVGFWIGAGRICYGLIGGLIVGGLISIFFPPIGIIVGIILFIGMLQK